MFYRFARFVLLIIFRILYRVKVFGQENIPSQGGVIICANHASALDPIFIGISMKRSLRPMAKKELFQGKALGALFYALGAFPVDRKNVSMDTYKNAINLLKNGECLLIFSQGSRMKEIDVKSAKSGVALFALKSNAIIIPTGVSSTYKLFAPVCVRFGKPINLDRFRDVKLKTENLNEITEEIMEKVKIMASK